MTAGNTCSSSAAGSPVTLPNTGHIAVFPAGTLVLEELENEPRGRRAGVPDPSPRAPTDMP
jgi:hypothetical protein